MAGEASPRTSGTHADGLDPLGAAVSRSYIIRAPFTGLVTSAVYTPLAAIPGVATNNRTLRLRQRGQDGALGVVVASLDFDAASGGASAFVAKAIPVTPANAAVVEGDVLEFLSAPAGTGAADPGGTLTVSFSRIAP